MLERHKLTDDLQVSLSASHGIGVDLAHVPSSVDLLHILNVKVPSAVIGERKAYTWILGDDVVVYRQYRLGVDAYPRNLRTE